MAFISDNWTTLNLLESRARQAGDTLFAGFAGRSLTVTELLRQTQQMAAKLSAIGIGRGDRVAVMLDNNLDYVVLFFALIWVGAIQIPVNTRLRHDSLQFLLQHSAPKLIIAEEDYCQSLQSAGCLHGDVPLLCRMATKGIKWGVQLNSAAGQQETSIESAKIQTHDVLFIMYTSGTTGPPKGVMVTDKMLRASAYAAARTSDARTGDIFPVWEPLYHIGAAQLLPMALATGVQLQFIGSFSASQFWLQVHAVGATQIHFLGGILQILLRQPNSELDQTHGCRIAWGGGAPVSVARAFESRFGIEVRENYGMTEASSLTSINHDGHKGSVGTPAPYFDVMIVDKDNQEVATGAHGEIIVRERESGLITPGYFRNDAATRSAIRDSWLHTGDLGYLDRDGYLYYAGRLKESIRRRGENISAWEIERVVERLDFVEQAAAIGVPDELGDEEIKLFIKLTEVTAPTDRVHQVFEWCNQHLAEFQWPQYVEVLDQFPMTGTQRIRKELLSRSIDGNNKNLYCRT